MTMFGGTGETFPPSGFFCVRNEFLREPDGGGDFSRGDIGHEGVVSPGVVLVLDVGVILAGLAIREVGSEVGGSCGVVDVERLR